MIHVHQPRGFAGGEKQRRSQTDPSRYPSFQIRYVANGCLECGAADFLGCLLLLAILLGAWALVVSASEGWSRGPLYFAIVVIAIPSVLLGISWLTSSLTRRSRKRVNAVAGKRLREAQQLEKERKIEAISYENTHCEKCGGSDIEPTTTVYSRDTIKTKTEVVYHYDSEGNETGRSEYSREVPTVTHDRITSLTCRICGNVWRQREL